MESLFINMLFPKSVSPYPESSLETLCILEEKVKPFHYGKTEFALFC